MKKVKAFSFILLSIIMISIVCFSCKKDTNTTFYTIEGKWLGAYFYTGDNTENFIGFNFKTGGNLDVFQDPNNKDLVGTTGTWTMVNNEITLIVPISNTKLTTTFNSKVGKLTGTWGNNPSSSDKGTWTVSKQ
jgi:hypothetical protein